MLPSALRRCLSATALLLVAAPLRADTLKVPGDFDTIQAAVDAAVAGDVVQVSKGVYAENVVIATAGITLKGKSATIDGRYTGNCLTIDANDVTVQSLTLANGGGEPLPPDGGTTGGLHALGTGITLSKLTVLASGTFGILLEGKGSVTQCKVDVCHGDGIDVVTGDLATAPVTVISKNTVTRCDNGLFASGGYFEIEKNVCEDNLELGLFVQVPTAIADGPPAFNQTTISKNTLRNNLVIGLLVQQGDAESPGVLVENNTVEHNGTGCRFEGSFIDASGNTVQDNVGDGIVVVASSCTLSKNKVKGNARVGIIVDAAPVVDGTPAPPGENALDQNTVQDNGGDGIQITSSSNGVNASTIKDNGGDGIQIAPAANSNVVAESKVLGNAHDGIDNSGFGASIGGNTCKDNGGADLAGAGDGSGTVTHAGSDGNVVSDDSDVITFTTLGELDLPL